jgi:phosphoglycerate dehydrogenase-like enzyme
MENVVLLPHLGSATHETRVAMGQRAVENLRRFRGTGVERITLRLASWDQAGQLDRVIREVLPYVNR